MSNKDIYTTKEAAQLMGICQQAVRAIMKRDIRDGRQKHKIFPNAKKFGRVWQIPSEDINKYLESKKK